MPDKKTFIQQIVEETRKLSSGTVGAFLGFLIGILWMTFGFWKMLFILLLTILGYLAGIRFFSRKDSLRHVLDRIFPPGLFR